MVKCSKCGTGWTSQGLPLCPICGTRVESPPAPAAAPRPEAAPVAAPATEFVRAPANGTALLEAPPKVEAEPVREVVPAPLLDPSAAAIPALPERGRTAARPLNGPLILGTLSYVAAVLLPLSVLYENHRILGVLGFCMTGFFAPFAPIAWVVGLAAERRRRDQGLLPEGRVSLGRLLGQWGTLLLVAEVTVALVAIAALRLSGRFPVTFWAPVY